MNESGSDSFDMRRLGLPILTVVLGGFFFGCIHEGIDVRAMKAWPLVNARVTAATPIKGCNKGVAFNVMLSYAYSVDGLKDGSGSAAWPPKSCSDAQGVTAILSQHPVGSILPVRVNPNDSNDSRADEELTADNYGSYASIFGVGFLVMFLFQFKSIRRLFA